MRKTRTFSHFFPVTSPLREGVKVLGITPHLLNVSVQAEARFGADSLERLVRLFIILMFSGPVDF